MPTLDSATWTAPGPRGRGRGVPAATKSVFRRERPQKQNQDTSAEEQPHGGGCGSLGGGGGRAPEGRAVGKVGRAPRGFCSDGFSRGCRRFQFLFARPLRLTFPAAAPPRPTLRPLLAVPGALASLGSASPVQCSDPALPLGPLLGAPSSPVDRCGALQQTGSHLGPERHRRARDRPGTWGDPVRLEPGAGLIPALVQPLCCLAAPHHPKHPRSCAGISLSRLSSSSLRSKRRGFEVWAGTVDFT